MRRQLQLKNLFLQIWPISYIHSSFRMFTQKWRQILQCGMKILISIIIPSVQIVAVMCLVFFLSVILFWYLRSSWIPKAILHEPIHFDYSNSPFHASIALPSVEKQWNYAASKFGDPTNDVTTNVTTIAQQKPTQVLHRGGIYDIDLVFTLAKSKKNYETATSPVKISMLDAYENLIAVSSRALVIPYQSDVSLFWEAIYLLPWRLAASMPIQEVVRVEVRAMSEYQESYLRTQATQMIRITMDRPWMDIQSATITILPKLSGLT